ncbi:hypothetical protein TWF718_010864 [Orbilia javanica]|uniref:Uncharacterized protein n=1 Tax=Orbilia javanica TaxID=47235 RepID=A0AAN8MKD2_9PEZI
MSKLQLGFKDLVGEMEGKNTLNGWDILVSYSLDQLNLLLGQRAQQDISLNGIDPFDVTLAVNPFDTSEQITYTVNLQMSALEMQFTAGTDAGVQLTLQLTGTATNTSTNEEITLPAGQSVQITTSLVHVAGSSSGSSSSASTPGSVNSPANCVIIVEEGTTHSICIDLTNPSVQIIPPPPSDGQANTLALAYTEALNSIITSVITNYFQTSGIQLQLAGINSSAESTGFILQPTAFCFSTVATPSNDAQDPASGSSASQDAALLIWISVAGGANNGQRPSGQTPVTFQPADDVRSPMPTGSSASVIFSHDIMIKSFIEPSLSSIGFSDITVQDSEGDEGITLSLKCPPMTTNLDDGTTQNVLYIPTGGEGITQGIDVDVSATDAHLQIRSPPALRGSNLPSLPGESTYEKDAGSTGSPPNASYIGLLVWVSPDEGIQWYGGATALRFSFAATANWLLEYWGNSINQLNFIWFIDPTFTVKRKDSEVRLGFAPPVEGWKPKLPSAFNMMTDPLNYFLVTNLLFPGDYTFRVDDPSFTTETQGLAVPRDVILTGSLTQSLPSNNPSTQAVALMEIPPLSQEQVSTAQAGNPPQPTQTPTQQDIDQMLQSFLQELSDPSPTSLFFKLFNVFQGTDTNAQIQNFLDIIDSQGYASLTGDQIGNLIGWDLAKFSSWAQANGLDSPSSTPGTPTTSSTPNPVPAEVTSPAPTEVTSPVLAEVAGGLDQKAGQVVRGNVVQNSTEISAVWAKLYKVDNSGTSELVIFQDGESVSYPYENSSSPKTIFTALTPDIITWKDDSGNTYDITFSSAPDPTTFIFTASFLGSCTDSSGKITQFSGTEATPSAPSGSPMTPEQIFDYVNGGLGTVIGIIGLAAAAFWRRDDKKNEHKFLDDVTKTVSAAYDKKRGEIAGKITEAVNELIRRNARTIMNKDFGASVEKTIEGTIKGQLSDLQLQDDQLTALGNAVVQGTENETLTQIQAAVSTAVHNQLLMDIASPLLPKLTQTYSHLLQAGLLDDKKVVLDSKAFVDNELMPKFADAQADVPGSSFLDQQIKSSLLQWTSAAINRSLSTITKALDSAKANITTRETNLVRLKAQLAEIEGRNTDQAVIQQAQADIQTEEQEIVKLKTKKDNAQNQQTTLEADSKGQAEEQSKAQDNVKKMGEEIFPGE